MVTGKSLRYFGTDGVRGKAGSDITVDFARDLGRAAGLHLLSVTDAGGAGRRRAVALGHDTRISSPNLAEACAEGLSSAGLNVIYLGTVPTAVVAFAVVEFRLSGGCVVSASHNPPDDNGIKFFGAGGYKLGPEEEAAIEKILDETTQNDDQKALSGRIEDDMAPSVVHRYKQHVLEVVGDVKGIKTVLDCANGAASSIGPEVLEALGAHVLAVAAEGDGSKINTGCGATDPCLVLRVTKESGYSIGLAVDGDADRLVAVDDHENVYDGDHLMAAFASWMLEHKRLDPPLVVATVMSNLGLRIALEKLGIGFVECGVGDREVVKAMRAAGAKLGGEQSGHIVFGDYATTGDGILTAALLLSLLSDTKMSISEITSIVENVPQLLVNVEVADKAKVFSSTELASCIESAKQRLGTRGRLVVRPSGTEPYIRVMVESLDENLARSVVDEVTSAIHSLEGRT